MADQVVSRKPRAHGAVREVSQVLMQPPFVLLWLSETALDIGSALMSFALGVWIYQRTGSAEQFSHVILAAAIPALLLSPVAGAMADRLDRRWVIAGCDMASVLMVVLLALLLFHDSLAVRDLYIFNAFFAVIGVVRTPAYRAAVGVIVSKDHMTRANALISLTQGFLQIGAPLIAGYVMGNFGLKGIMVIEVIMVLAAALAVFGALSRARNAIRGIDESEHSPIVESIITSFLSAIRYFKREPQMSGLATYAVLQESLLVLVTTMMTPLVLSTNSSKVLGLILTCGALGSVAGSLLLLVMRINKRLMVWVLVSDVALSLFVLLAGFTTSTVLLCVCAFFSLFAGSASGTCAGALWMRKTPKAKQGSIFSLLNAIKLLAMCVVLLAGGSLGEHFFEPALAVGGAWAGTVGVLVGTGKGRGIGFMFIVCGAVSCLMSLIALMYTRLRHLDELVCDQPDEPKFGSELTT